MIGTQREVGAGRERGAGMEETGGTVIVLMWMHMETKTTGHNLQVTLITEHIPLMAKTKIKLIMTMAPQ